MARAVRADPGPLAGGRPLACAELDAVAGGPEAGWQVRNTFIHGGLARSPSLEAFYSEREVSSCPGCRVGCLEDLFHEEVVTTVSDRCGQSDSTTVSPVLTPRSGWSETESGAAQHSMWQYIPPMLQATMQQPVIVHDPAAAAAHNYTASWPSSAAAGFFQPWAAEEEVAAPFFVGAPDELAPSPYVASSAFAAPQAPPEPHAGRMLVRLADTLLADDDCGGTAGARERPPHDLQLAPLGPRSLPPAEAAPGSEELPSVGSAQHGEGRCKPCAFVHSKGCADGPLCQFCHMCDAGEKKRRQREKLRCRKAAFRGRRASSPGY